MEFVTIYTSKAICARSGLTLDEIVLVALLLGGDLDKVHPLLHGTSL